MRKLIGDKKFYKMVLAIAIPIMIQNGITNFVSMLDNIMVGRVGTEQMSGVSIVNQLMFVFNVCIFGIISGAGIFGAQFFGNGNHEGMKHTFRFKMITCILFSFVGFFVLSGASTELISLYLKDGNQSGDAVATLAYGKDYLKVMLIGLFPFAVSQAYSSTLREKGETVLPMIAGITAVLVNLVFNAILIFGLLGAPALGVVGAAIATVISRFVECSIIVVWTHRHKEKNLFIKGAYQSLHIPKHLISRIIITGTPLMLNEALWSIGMATMLKQYSERGLDVVAGMNISTTISNVFNIVFIAMGNAVAIIVGQLLGAGKMEEAKDTSGKLIFFSVTCCIFLGIAMIFIAPFFPLLYNTSTHVRNLASWFIVVSAACMPLYAFMHATYFTLRSGGKTIITFLFDSVFVWVASIPCAYFLANYTTLPIVTVYLICQLIEIIKCVIGFVLLKKGVWLHNIVSEPKIS